MRWQGDVLTLSSIIRNQSGEMNIIPADAESEIYYTNELDVFTN